MPRVTIDATEAVSRKPVEDGTYNAEITAVTGPHKGPNSQYLKAELTLRSEGVDGRKLFLNLPIEKAGAGITVDFINKATGSDYDVDQLENIDLDTDELIGLEVGVTTKQKEYPEGSGEFQSEIKKVLSAR